MAKGDAQEEEEDLDEREQVLFQGPMYGRDANLKQNPRLVQAALVPVKRMVTDALSRRAHTVLLEPAPGKIAIRFVVDGIAYPAGAVPARQGVGMVQMLKLLAGLDPQKRTVQQSGGIRSEYTGKAYRLLVLSTPVKGGAERLRIRIENPKDSFIRPQDVGVPNDLRQKIRDFTSDSKGIVLACGPPDSGITSLSLVTLHCTDPYLYSVFNLADVGEHSLVNVADYEPEEGHDLAFTLDRISRREADLVYMPPFTDPKTTQLLFDFSDRLCFVGEIPCRTPIEAVQTLIQWVGVDSVLKHLKGVVTHKLIRKLCDDCKQAFRPNPQLLKRLGLPPEVTVLYRAPAPPPADDPEAPTIEELCADCNGMPYYGRIPCFEVLEMSDGMKEVVAAGADPAAMRQQMFREDMRTLQKDALRLVVEGKTSLEEVQRSFQGPKGRPAKKRRPRPQA
ncbi:MAG: ATPase, T2SS/T4P/T4SS family [Planctomycetaceae bacterium]